MKKLETLASWSENLNCTAQFYTVRSVFPFLATARLSPIILFVVMLALPLPLFLLLRSLCVSLARTATFHVHVTFFLLLVFPFWGVLLAGFRSFGFNVL